MFIPIWMIVLAVIAYFVWPRQKQETAKLRWAIASLESRIEDLESRIEDKADIYDPDFELSLNDVYDTDGPYSE